MNEVRCNFCRGVTDSFEYCCYTESQARACMEGRATPDPVYEGKKELEPLKYDQGKPPVALVAPEYILGTAEVLGFGANKYAAGNWACGSFEASRLVSAMQRHVMAYMSGEDKDPESGLHHLYHASCCLMFLTAQMERGQLTDDRALVGAAKETLR